MLNLVYPKSCLLIKYGRYKKFVSENELLGEKAQLQMSFPFWQWPKIGLSAEKTTGSFFGNFYVLTKWMIVKLI